MQYNTIQYNFIVLSNHGDSGEKAAALLQGSQNFVSTFAKTHQLYLCMGTFKSPLI